MNALPSRSRALAALVALPLALSAAPFTGLAQAAVTVTITPLSVPNGKVGPNAGYLDPAQGVSGTTAIARLTVSDPSVTLQQLVVHVAGPSISVFRDFATTDGFALYKDVGAAGFSAEDHAAGPVSDGLRAGTPSGGRTPLTIVTNPEKAKDAGSYLLTVHPAVVDVGDRAFTVSMDSGAISTSDNATSSPAISLPQLTADSRAPQKPAPANFSVSRQPAGTEDGYTISNERTEADKAIAFFNSPTETALSNLLIRAPEAGGGRVIHAAPPFPSLVKIGDGTGITKTVTTARNNQRGEGAAINQVHVRAIDSIGNLSTVTTLIDAKTNDVTAPLYTTHTVLINAAGVNASNRTAVPVRTNNNASGNTATNSDSGIAIEQIRLVALDAAGNQIGATEWSQATRSSGQVDRTLDATPLGEHPAKVIAQSRLGDVHGNLGDVLNSAPVNFDLGRPQILSVAPVLDASPAGPSPNDLFRVFFSEPMDKSKIADTVGVRTPCPPAQSSCVNNRLLLPGDPIPDSPAGTTPVNWGVDPGFAWSADGTSATITTGNATPGGRTPKVGDQVSTASQVTDPVGNSVINAVIILDPGLLPAIAVSRDDGGSSLFAQGADGRLDTVEITMSGNILGSSVAAAAPNFRVVGSPGEVVPFVAEAVDASKIRLRFDSTMLTGERPTVRLVEPSPGAGTGLVSATNVPVRPFSLGTDDKARPAAIGAVTVDADKNGHIDGIEIKFSEPIIHDRELAAGGYSVPGYHDTAAGAPGASNTKMPLTGSTDTTVIALEEADDFDTEATPTFSYAGKIGTQINGSVVVPGNDICDSFNNCRLTFTAAVGDVLDAAQPVIVARKTMDLDSDGAVDAVGVQFSEPLLTASIPNATLAVPDRTVSAVVPVSSGNPDTLLAVVNELPQPTAGDTDAKLKVQYTGGAEGGARDAAVPTTNAAVVDAAAVESTDGAGPAIVAATTVGDGAGPGDGTKVKVFLSEVTEQIAAGDFSVSGISKASGQSVTQDPSAAAVATDKKSVELTLDDAIDPLFDGTVEFAGAGVVADAVTPTPNLNTQTSPVSIPPFPIAILDAKGPAGSANGYSISKTFTTGAAGNSGVTGWCLVVKNVALEGEPAAPENGDDACFKVETPATHTVAIDGTYKLLLVTKNRFGNLSVPATDTIVVDSAGPVAELVYLERLGAGRTGTVRDNDTVRIVVNTSGSSPSTFTATADYSALTGNPNDTAVPSFNRSAGTFNFPYRVASGTTVYPVGTVLAINNDGGQPFILEDGPDGKVVKRRFLSAQAMSTYRIPSSLVIRVPAAVLNPVPTAQTKYYRDGQLVRANGSDAVYVITENTKRLIPDRAVFSSLRYSFTSVIVVPPADLAKVPDGEDMTAGATRVHPVGTYVRNATQGSADYGKVYVILKDADGDAVKRHVVSSTALLSHITINQVVNVPATDPSLLVPTDALKRGMRDGMLVREPNDPRVYAVSRGARRHINSRGAFDLMGFSFRNVVVVGREHIGIPVNSTVPVGTRRVPFSVTVRDPAGNTNTRATTVVGLGIPEPLPETAPGAPRP